MKLNVGCGRNILDGYENLDLYVGDPRVILCDVRRLPYDDKSIDKVLAEDILEHFPRLEWKSVVAEWWRVLKPGGDLTVQFPDMIGLSKVLQGATTIEEWEHWNRKIFGGQGDGVGHGSGKFHCTGFSSWYLREYLHTTFGAKIVSATCHDYNCTIVAEKSEVTP